MRNNINWVVAGTAFAVATLFSILVVEPVTEWVYGDERALGVTVFGFALLLFVLMLALAVRWHSEESKQHEALASEFDLFGAPSNILPKDFGLTSSLIEKPHLPVPRPFNVPYVDRRFVRIEQFELTPEVLATDSIAATLTEPSSVIIVSAPMDGRSRASYEVIKRLPGNTLVISPPRTGVMPSNNAFSLIKGRAVLVLIDDLDCLPESTLDIMTFVEQVYSLANSTSIIATTRDGTNLRELRGRKGSSSSRLVEMSTLFRMLPLDSSEKRALAEGIGKNWHLFDENRFSTPGSIVMDRAMSAMSHRFDSLEPTTMHLLSAVKLLDRAGIATITLDLVAKLSSATLGYSLSKSVSKNSLDFLRCEGFLRDFSNEVVTPEFAYLRSDAVVPYHNARSLVDDLVLVVDELIARKDNNLNSVFHAISTDAGPNKALELMERLPDEIASNEEWLTAKALLLLNADRLLEAMDVIRSVRKPQLRNFIEAKIFERMGEFSIALSLIDGVLGGDPTDRDLADDLKTSVSDEMLHMQELAQNHDPPSFAVSERALAYATKASLLSRLDRRDEAIAIYDSILKIYRNWLPVRLGRARVLWYMGRRVEAVHAIDEIMEIEQNMPGAWYARAQMLYEMGDYEEALKSVDRSLHVGGTRSDVMRTRLDVLGKLRSAIEVIEYGKAILNVDETAENVHRAVAVEYLKLEDDLGALPFLDRAVILDPNDESAWRHKCICHFNLNDYGLAAAAFNQIVHSKDKEPLYTIVGMCRFHLSEYDAAIELLDEAIQNGHANQETWRYKEMSHFNLFQFDEAVDAFRHQEALSPGSVEIDLIGLSLFHIDQPRHAVIYLDRFLVHNPNELPHLQARALSYVKIGLIKDALADFSRLADLEPDRWEHKSNLAQCFVSLDRLDEAFDLISTTLSTVEHSLLYVRRADLWVRKGNRDEARQDLLKAKTVATSPEQTSEVEHEVMRLGYSIYL